MVKRRRTPAEYQIIRDGDDPLTIHGEDELAETTASKGFRPGWPSWKKSEISLPVGLRNLLATLIIYHMIETGKSKKSNGGTGEDTMKTYGLEQVGCYATGYKLGANNDYFRFSLSEVLVDFLGDDFSSSEAVLSAESLIDELCADPSDDLSEEDDAIDLLNKHATDDTVSFGMHLGDLILAPNREWK
jgi:hypothetical protein